MNEGWVFALNWRKAHYVRKGTSLCGKWAYLGSQFIGAAGDKSSPDDCRACTGALARGTLSPAAERR